MKNKIVTATLAALVLAGTAHASGPRECDIAGTCDPYAPMPTAPPVDQRDDDMPKREEVKRTTAREAVKNAPVPVATPTIQEDEHASVQVVFPELQPRPVKVITVTREYMFMLELERMLYGKTI